MSINIHGKEYVTVAERIQELHKSLKTEDDVSIMTEIVSQDPIIIKATVMINGNSYNGISAANLSKAIEKDSPYEIAETSAVGRALAFAGFGSIESIASADEVAAKQRSSVSTISSVSSKPSVSTIPSGPIPLQDEKDEPVERGEDQFPGEMISDRQKDLIATLVTKHREDGSQYTSLQEFEAEAGFSIESLSKDKASRLIEKLFKRVRQIDASRKLEGKEDQEKGQIQDQPAEKEHWTDK